MGAPEPAVWADRPLNTTTTVIDHSPALSECSKRCYTSRFLEEGKLQPRSAAAVILYRESPELEVYWVRRSPKMMFMGGYHAFPGGQAERGEDMTSCAVRELEEELGVRVDPAAPTPVGRWVTPAFAPRRFDTCFFLTRCPEGQNPAPDTPELDQGEWIRPGDAVALWEEGSIMMAPPIRYALETLSSGLDDIESRMTEDPRARGGEIHAIEMRKGIVLVPVRTPTLPPATHTNCYLVGGDEVIVIDPASPYPEEQAILDSVLEDVVAEGRRIREIWLTHRHSDHISGANHLRDRWKVSIAAHEVTADEIRGIVEVDRFLVDGERVELAGDPGWTLQVMHTPGHARGHVCILEEKRRSVITGDLMAGIGTILIDPPEGHMATYLASLRQVEELNPEALFFAHGPAAATALEKLHEYIDHRMKREANILKAWERGTRTADEIVPEVYTDVDPEMWSLAERSVTAHLEKLQEEGRI